MNGTSSGLASSRSSAAAAGRSGSDVVSGAAPGFLGLPPELSSYSSARVALLPVPYDATTSYRAGTRDGARAIVDASRQLELYDADLRRTPAEVGIHTLDELEPDFRSPGHMVQRVHEATSSVLRDGKLPVLLGGEHSLTPGAVAACREQVPALGVLHLDAHADLRESYHGTPQSHACAIRRVLELGCSVVSVGIRSLSEEEALYRDRAAGIDTVSAADVARVRYDATALNALWDGIVARLPASVYITIDLDVFDPALMEAVGTPEPGGLDWWEVTGLLRRVCEARTIVGFDVVELAPDEGPVSCAFAAAKLTYTIIGYAMYASV